MATKSKRVSVGKRELQETANAVEDIAIQEGVLGLDQAKEGVDKLEAAREVGTLGRGALAVGVARCTRGADEMAVAEGLSQNQRRRGSGRRRGHGRRRRTAGRFGGRRDPERDRRVPQRSRPRHAMGIAAIAGQLAVVADIVAMRDMPVLADFLEAKGEALHQLAVESIVKFAAGRAVSESMAQTAARVGELGADEMAEGMVASAWRKSGAVSEAMAEAGAESIKGAVEIEAAQELARSGRRWRSRESPTWPKAPR